MPICARYFFLLLMFWCNFVVVVCCKFNPHMSISNFQTTTDEMLFEALVNCEELCRIDSL